MIENNKRDIVSIEVELWDDGKDFGGKVDDNKLPEFNSCIVQGDSEDDVKENLKNMMGFIMEYYKEIERRYCQRAIFRGNCSTNQLWFTIIGFGMIFYWRPKRMRAIFPKIKPTYSFHIGNLYFSFKNEWKRYPNK